MQIVIDIPDGIYQDIEKRDWKNTIWARDSLMRYIHEGVVLPEHHGRLIDADRLKSMYSINRAYLYFNTVVGIQKWVDDAPTILEATEEVD